MKTRQRRARVRPANGNTRWAPDDPAAMMQCRKWPILADENKFLDSPKSGGDAITQVCANSVNNRAGDKTPSRNNRIAKSLLYGRPDNQGGVPVKIAKLLDTPAWRIAPG
ncbi:hypothetical protein FHW84_004305 [Dyella sp. SG562]|uniref:hypothetical protein n=1 Tax=Dyella sp. SG562 TaxID=2587017 RepID=UPI00141F543E|nr:hypothetical protein [Dyella sp. SG562]NII75694.1 hypothetical protein [Dyella sp. SG562]